MDFINTCYACPEQYDVKLEDMMLAYIRLRFGHLTVEVPDVGGTLIYKHTFQNAEMKGCFSSDEERDLFLSHIEKLLEKYYGL